jgi:translocation protein SEC62
MAQTEIPKDLLTIANFLLSSSSQLRLRQGVLSGNRAEFFKGKHAVNAMLRPTYPHKSRPEVQDRATGEAIVAQMLEHQLIFRVEKQPMMKNLSVTQDQTFSNDYYYIWLYKGSQLPARLMGIGIMLVIFAGVLYPLWPPFMRQGAYYGSMGVMSFLGFVLALGVIRVIIYLLLILSIGRGGWLFPNLWADLGILESFIPVWAYLCLK